MPVCDLLSHAGKVEGWCSKERENPPSPAWNAGAAYRLISEAFVLLAAGKITRMNIGMFPEIAV